MREFGKVDILAKTMMMMKTARHRLCWKAVENVGNCMLQAAKLGRIVIILIRICGRRRVWVWIQLQLQSACKRTRDADLLSRDLACCWWGSLLFRINAIAFSCLNFSKSFIVAFYEIQTCACCKLLLQTTRTLCASMLLLLQKITCSSGKYLDSFINEIQIIWDQMSYWF